MKNLVLTALLCAPLATGCVITTEEESTITASWSLVAGDANSPTDCPPGATTIAMYAEDSADVQTVDLFDCATGLGTSGDLNPGPYYVWLELQDDAGQVVYAQSRGTDVTVFDGADSTLSYEFSIDRGEFAVAWEVFDGVDAADCATVGATIVALDYTDVNNEFFGPDEFACDAGSGVTPGIALGDWTISPALIDDTELALAVGTAIEETIPFGSAYIDLGVVSFDVQAP